MTESPIEIELLPHERARLLKWGYPFEDVKEQLKAAQVSRGVANITITLYYLGLLIGDLSNAITKRSCRDEAVFDLCDRLEYIERSGDGSLDIY